MFVYAEHNLYAEHIMRNAGLAELQAGIGRRNINNLRYADTTLVAESEEELKNLLMRVKEKSEKVSLGLNIKKKKKQLKLWHLVPLLYAK